MRETDDDGKNKAVKKPTRYMTSSEELVSELGKICRKDHEHTHIRGGGRSMRAAVYPKQLCEAICRGVAKQREADSRNKVKTSRMDEDDLKDLLCMMERATVRRLGIPRQTDRTHQAREGDKPV